MRKRYLYYQLLFNLILINYLPAQDLKTDSAIYRSAIQHIIQLYADSVKENLRLYNGNEYTGAFSGFAGHPFFEYREPQKGEVYYGGIYYQDVLLSYDIVTDQVIFLNPVRNLNIKLFPEKTEWFGIQDHLFRNIQADSLMRGFPGIGFYEVLFEGSGLAMAKRRKQLYQAPRADEVARFIGWDAYYIRKDSVYHTINSKRSLLSVCKDRKTEVSRFMQKENLNFKKNPANTIKKVMNYYTQLKNN